MSTITTGKVIIYKPNFNVNPLDTLLDLPVLGAENTLYVIKDTGVIYLWNGSEFVTTTTPTSKTVYVDADNGSDVTGNRGYVNFPYQTLNAAITDYQSGDTIILGKGSYTRTTQLPVISNFNLVSNGDLTLGSLLNTVDTSVKELNIKATKINGTGNFVYFANTKVNLDVDYLTTSSTLSLNYGQDAIIKIKDFIKTSNAAVFYIGMFNGNLYLDVDNYSFTGNSANPFLQLEQGTADTSGGKLLINIKKYNFISSIGSLFSNYHINGFLKSDYDCIFNIQEVYQRGWISTSTDKSSLIISDTLASTWSNINIMFNLNIADIDYTLFFKRRGIYGTNYTLNIDLLKISSSSILMFGTDGTAMINSNITFNIKKGNVNSVFNQYTNGTNQTILTNSTIIINGDITTNTDVTPRLTLDATSKLIFKGRFNLGDKKFDLSNIDGAGADNVYFDDCTIITTGTNSIDAGSAKNIKVKSTYSNKVASANITALIDPIVVDAIIN